jgi:hypothetical protein
MRILAAVMMMLILPGVGAASPCGAGARLDYPLSAVLNLEAQGYVTTAIMRTDFDAVDLTALVPYAPAYAAVLAERAAALPPTLADLPYMLALAEVATYPNPLYSLTYLAQSTALPRIVEALDRQGLVAEAALARMPLGVFADWSAGPDARRKAMEGAAGNLLAGLRGRALDLASRRLHLAAPRLVVATEALIASDPKVAAEYESRRMATDTDTRMAYLAQVLVSACMGDWWTPSEADADFAVMARPQADIMVMQFFLWESFNGSAHQFFYNSSGTLAPQLAEVLDRVGLPDHAAGIRQGMAVFPGDYPRDTDARREVMAGFTTAQDDALYAITVWADDGQIAAAMARIAEATGLMPR